MNDHMQPSPDRFADPTPVDPTSDRGLERALDEWGRRIRWDDLDGGLADRVFAASRGAIAARRVARSTENAATPIAVARNARRSSRPSAWSLLVPARLALAAGLLAALLIPALLDLGGRSGESGPLAAGASAALEVAEPLGGTSTSEPLLLALIEPGTASWEDVAGHEPGVDLYAVLESGRAGLDDYLSELDAIFGTLDGAGEEM